MSIEKFEVGKKYRFLKDGDGDKLYCGVDAKKGQEFTVVSVENGCVNTKDVTYSKECNSIGWSVYIEEDEYAITTLDDFEEVSEVVKLFGETKELIKGAFSEDLSFEVANLMKKTQTQT